MKLHLSSEQVSPTGNVASEGILNQLGRPNLDLFAILVREAVQNSWDARSSKSVPVRFGISGWTLNGKQRKVLQNEVFADYPPEEEDTLLLKEHMYSGSALHVLAIYDRGTVGLGGPTRADLATNKDESRNFVDFLRDVGQPPERDFSGGTYGYGKAAFYRASKVHTICVHTCCHYQGKREQRFIASALGKPYTIGTIRYTGRHWWGKIIDGIAEPILNEEAQDLAVRLGMPHFETDEYGTTILVLQPAFEDDPLQTIDSIVDNILYYFWPKMLTFHNSFQPMIFDVFWQGKKREIPNPLSFPPLEGFVHAMRHLRGIEADTDNPFRHHVTDIKSQRPIQLLGKLALQQFPTSIIPNVNDNQHSIFRELTHHTALMRQPELVVTYLQGPVMPNNQFGYAGVFITNHELDPIFADSEPPTHDNWIPKSLSNRRHKSFVNVALTRIKEKMDKFVKPTAVVNKTSFLAPLGKFANNLGNSLIPSLPGPAATFVPFAKTEPMGTPKKGSKKEPVLPVKRAYVKVSSEGEFVIVNNTTALQLEFFVVHAQGSSGTHVTAKTTVVIDGTQTETEPPMGAKQSKVLYWIAPDGTKFSDNTYVFIPVSSKENWFVVVSMSEDVKLGVELKAESHREL